ncbi:ribonuclease E/G [Clostridium grantii]|uniref:Ribonuclease G n=1 Tax=Clostridium grantii DSM 8605 TaxID=1121316 RepID=A0A1M5X3T1_9CLOT|nr:ribonuclease E/G [Clostridium grantii]SHH94441.1 ribonuclease G [Clostridium grantii DSM 8605]
MEEIFIERQDNNLRIALREHGTLKECLFEEEFSGPSPGQIYVGVVKDVIPALNSAFIDIGHEKNAYMVLNKINKNIKTGDYIVVEIMKEALGEKGAKVTTNISVPGRYVVLISKKGVSFSKKLLEDKNYQEHIKFNLFMPKEAGVMIRTNSLNVDIEAVNEEVRNLDLIYEKIMIDGKHSLKPRILFDCGGILGRILMDIIGDNTGKVVVNNLEDYKYIKNHIIGKPDLIVDVELYEEKVDLFCKHNIEKEILSLRNTKVPLKNGGNIVIERTEAMHVIDINSASNINEKDMEKTAFETNLEAAKEISKQIMLRNLSGIIIIDFIRMTNFNNMKKISAALIDGFKYDKKKTMIFPPTKLNLVQISRKRRGKTIYEYIEEECGLCRGKGNRIKLHYLLHMMKNEMVDIEEKFDFQNIYIELDEIYKKDVQGNVVEFIKQLKAFDKTVYVNFIENLNNYKIEPLLFNSQINKIKHLKIYDCNE